MGPGFALSLYFAGVLQRKMLIYAHGIDVESHREPRLLWSSSSSSCQPGMESLCFSHEHKTLLKTSWSFPSRTRGFTRFVYLIKTYMGKEYPSTVSGGKGDAIKTENTARFGEN